MSGMIAEKTTPKGIGEGFSWDIALLREDEGSSSVSYGVLMCRSGDGSTCAGRRMAVSDGFEENMVDDARPLVTLQADGISILSARYRRATGVILYYRTACAPDAAARVLGCGAFPRLYQVRGNESNTVVGGREKGDQTDYRLIADMVDAEEMLRTAALFGDTASRTLTMGEIRRTVESFAELVGCEVQLDLPAHIYDAVCYQTAATDVILLYGLLLIRQYAATRSGICRVRTMGDVDGGRLVIEMEMTPYQLESRPEESSSWRFMRSVAEANGMELDARCTDGTWRMTLTCLCDPARELSGDLKAEAELT